MSGICMWRKTCRRVVSIEMARRVKQEMLLAVLGWVLLARSWEHWLSTLWMWNSYLITQKAGWIICKRNSLIYQTMKKSMIKSEMTKHTKIKSRLHLHFKSVTTSTKWHSRLNKILRMWWEIRSKTSLVMVRLHFLKAVTIKLESSVHFKISFATFFSMILPLVP